MDRQQELAITEEINAH